MLITSPRGSFIITEQIRETVETFKNRLRRQLFKVRWAQAHAQIDPDDACELIRALNKKIASI